VILLLEILIILLILLNYLLIYHLLLIIWAISKISIKNIIPLDLPIEKSFIEIFIILIPNIIIYIINLILEQTNIHFDIF